MLNTILAENIVKVNFDLGFGIIDFKMFRGHYRDLKYSLKFVNYYSTKK